MFTFVSLALSEESATNKILFMTEIYPPANYIENGELKGASVDILKLIWQEMNVNEQEIIVLPWARAYENILSHKNYALFSMSRSKSREKLFKWVGPIFVSTHVLVGLSRNQLKINNIDDAKKYRIGALINDISETALLDLGFPRENIESLTDISANIQKLMNGRLDLLCQSEESYRDLAGKFGYKLSDFKVYAVVNEIPNYYAFNINTPDEIIEKYQNALNKIDAKRRIIVEKYNMTP